MKRKIIIDPGHGGIDPGAVGEFSEEKNIVLSMANILKELLQMQGFDTRLTRRDDIKPSWPDRVKSKEEDLFVSLHCNAVAAQNVKGISNYHYPGSETGEKLAHAIQENLMSAFDTRNKGVKEKYWYVLRNTKCPAVLVETGFISNPKEEEKLNRFSYQVKAMLAIVEAIKTIKESD